MVRTGVFKVLKGDVIHRKEAHSGVVLRAHVSDGGPIGSRELLYTRPKELHKLPANSCLTQMLRHKDQISAWYVISRDLQIHWWCYTFRKQGPRCTLVMPSTISMDVARGLMVPTSLQPTTCGRVKDTGWPNMTASDSMPPTPEREHERDNVR